MLGLVGKNNNSWIDVCMENEDVCVDVTYVSIQAEEGIAGRYQVGIEANLDQRKATRIREL